MKTLKNIIKKILATKHQKRLLVLGGIVGVLAGLGIVVGVASIVNPGIPAQVADNVLRPLIGEKNTLALEALYFNTSEKLKKVEYSFVPVDTSDFAAPVSSSLPEKNVDNMNISSIPVQHSFTPLKGEGIWQPVPSAIFPNQLVMAKTLVRPDPNRPYATVEVVQFDMQKLGINTEAGIKYPGGSSGMPGPGIVPLDIQNENRLVAVFNGGFQEKDGHYGMVVGDKTYLPLRPGLAALLMYKDGSAKMVEYGGQTFDKNVVSVRENGPFLLHNGVITPFVEAGRDVWGRTMTNSMYTWRSGVGITKEGNLLYAVGSSLVPETLAKALQEAGAVDAIQLDINPFWVRFYFYTPISAGMYSTTPLMKIMIKTGGVSYLHGYEKDFFYVYKK